MSLTNPFDLPKATVTIAEAKLLDRWAAGKRNELIEPKVNKHIYKYSEGSMAWNVVHALAWNIMRDSLWKINIHLNGCFKNDLIAGVIGEQFDQFINAYCFSVFKRCTLRSAKIAKKLWEAGLVPSFDGEMWRLHSGKNADVVYKWIPPLGEQ
jgi:hypothetical protein